MTEQLTRKFTASHVTQIGFSASSACTLAPFLRRQLVSDGAPPVDFISNSQTMKRLIKAPLSKQPLSLAVHRVGDTVRFQLCRIALAPPPCNVRGRLDRLHTVHAPICAIYTLYTLLSAPPRILSSASSLSSPKHAGFSPS
jgi:hypothetical protein